MYYYEVENPPPKLMHSRSRSMPEWACVSRQGARSRSNITAMMDWNLRYREPLRVDVSVEYDLGTAGRVPKDSAPLLIIHPAYKSLSPCSSQGRSPPLPPPPPPPLPPPVTRHASFVRPFKECRDNLRSSMPDIRAGGARTRFGLREGRSEPLADSGILTTPPFSSYSSTFSDEEEVPPVRTADSGIGSPSSIAPESDSSSARKWKNGVSGLVTGFFCCSSIQQPPPSSKNPAWHSGKPRSSKKQGQHRLSLPSSSLTSNSSSYSSSFTGRKLRYNNYECYHYQQHPQQRQTVQQHNHQQLQWSQYFPKSKYPSQSMPCYACRLANSVDCLDGFCSSVWNKETHLRPIQI